MKKPLIPKVNVKPKARSTQYAGRKNLTYRLPIETHEALKDLAHRRRMTMTELLDEAVRRLLESADG